MMTTEKKKPITFFKLGGEHVASLADGEALWIRPNGSDGVDLLWQRNMPSGSQECVLLGRHLTVELAVADAKRLVE
jgi:hypothetical protein